jgi:hypothetical protein
MMKPDDAPASGIERGMRIREPSDVDFDVAG